MRMNREDARRLAGTMALRSGLDPFESALDSGVDDATAGRLFEPNRAYDRGDYALGFELGRHVLLDRDGVLKLPSVEESTAIVAEIERRPNVTCYGRQPRLPDPDSNRDSSRFLSIFSGNSRKVIVSAEGVAAFNRVWPCSNLRFRSYWFEFDQAGDLIDSDVPESDDGAAASALADDCKAWLQDDDLPLWESGS